MEDAIRPDSGRDTSPLIDARAARAYLGGVGMTKLYDLLKRGEIEIVKLGSRTLFTRESLDALIARNIRQSPSPVPPSLAGKRGRGRPRKHQRPRSESRAPGAS